MQIRHIPRTEQYDGTVKQMAAAIDASETDELAITYQLVLSGSPVTEALIIDAIATTRGGHSHQLVVREPDDPEHQLFTIPLYALIGIEAVRSPLPGRTLSP